MIIVTITNDSAASDGRALRVICRALYFQSVPGDALARHVNSKTLERSLNKTMNKIHAPQFAARSRRMLTHTRLLFTLAGFSLLIAACGARDGAPTAGVPRANDAATIAPGVVLDIPAARVAAVNVAWGTLLRAQGINTQTPLALMLHPVTRTITSLPAIPAGLQLPRVGPVGMSAIGDEERRANERESLRRFVNDNATLFGATSDTTTLLEIAQLDSARRRATYEQRPFIYPLRAGYGRITIDFAPDGRVLNMTSTALPDAASADSAVRNLRATLTVDEARLRLLGATVDIRNAGARRALPTDEVSLRQAVNPTELVIYPQPLPPTNDATSLALRLAWEFKVADAAGDYVVFVDAVSGEILGTEVSRTAPAED